MLRKKITGCLKSCALGRLIYEPLRFMYRLYAVPARRRRLRKHGPGIMLDVSEILRRRNIPGFAMFGTLLGFVRDGGFIPHDDDIDMGVMPGSITAPELLRILLNEEKGFEFMFAFRYQDKMTEFKVMYKSVPIDFFFFEQEAAESSYIAYSWQADAAYPCTEANTATRMYDPAITGVKDMELFGGRIPIPENAEEWLEGHYGKSWRIPDPTWVDGKHRKLVKLPDFGYSLTREEALNM